MEITPGDILEKAAELLETEGWARNVTKTQDHRHCAEGAVICAAEQLGALNPFVHKNRLDQFANEEFKEAILFLCDQSQHVHGNYTTTWNDTQAKDQYEVIEFLKETAKEWWNEHHTG